MIDTARCTVLAIMVSIVWAGCRPSTETTEKPLDPSILATWDGGVVTAEDLDDRVLRLPPNERQEVSKDPGRTAEIVRDVAIDKILAEEIELTGLDLSPEFAARTDEQRRMLASQSLRSEVEARLGVPSEAELRARYESHTDEFNRPERRLVLHLFRRVTPEREPDRVESEVEAARRRFLAGEPFAALARELSESESRHQGGLLGWVSPGRLPAAVDEIVFTLDVGVPSEPVVTKEGVHLFFVSDHQAEQRLEFDDVRQLLAAGWRTEQMDTELRSALDEVELPSPVFVATNDELEGLVAAGDGEAVVFQDADFILSLGQLQASHLGQASGRRPGLPKILESIVARERSFHLMTERGLFERDDVQEQLASSLHQDAVRVARHQAIEQYLASQPERLQRYYENNVARFSGPLSVRARQLTVPFDLQSVNDLAVRLESAVERIDRGEIDLAELESAEGGTITDLGWVTIGQLSRLNPRVATMVAPLPTGHATPPFRLDETLTLIVVDERREPEPLPYASVLEEVRASYLSEHWAEIERSWAEAFLTDHSFEQPRVREAGDHPG